MGAKRGRTEHVSEVIADFNDKEKKARPEKTVKLAEYITDKPSEAFISSELTRFRNSQEYKDMVEGSRYYRLQCNIDKKKRMISGCDQGEAVEAKLLANTKLKHAFLYKLARQKISYLLSKPFSIQCDNDIYQKILSEQYFTPKFRHSIQKLATNAIIEGKSWIQAYVDTDGRIKFKFVKGVKVKPYWTDDEHNSLLAVMKVYDIVEVGEDGATYDLTRVEFYNQKGCWVYNLDGDTNSLSGAKVEQTIKDQDGNFVPYFMYREPVMDEDNPKVQKTVKDDEGNEVPLFSDEKVGTFNAVPFICVKYNDEEMPLLNFIKDKNDDYDEDTSGVSDFIKDVPSAVKVVKGYNGTKAQQFARNLATYRVIFVGEGGAVENLQSQMDSTTAKEHLDRLREDIYADGCGVDSSRTDSLGALSGVALKYLYQDLDIDCNNLWSSIDEALHQVLHYINLDLANQGAGDFENEIVQFIPNMDGLINENEVIQSINNSQGILSRETLIANHPWVTDPEKELELKKKQDEEDAARYNTYSFENPPQDEDNDNEEDE